VDRLYAVHLALFLRQRYDVVIRTHAKVVSVAPRGKEVVVEAALRNGERYETKGDYVVNATGPWADEIRNLVQIGVKPRLRLSRGSHLVFPKAHLPIEEGFLIPRTKDGRLLFVLPWIEGTVLVGTTDEEVKAPTWPAAVSEAETQFLIEHVKRYFGVNELEIRARFAGYRPLVAQRPNATAKLARTHVVEVWPSQRVISLMGGKWTTFRQMGEDAIAAIARLSGRNLAPGEPVLSVEPDLSELQRYQQGDAQPIVPGLPYTWGEVAFWQSLGWAQDPEDLVAGRWLLPFYDEQKAKQVREALQSKWHKLD
jgi:glycerol-3-phosphate dehydrogenase